MRARLELFGVSVIYPGQHQPIVQGCSFSVSPGEIVGILGDNGSGKTTLAQAVCGIIPHLIRGKVIGRIEVDRIDLATLSSEERFALVGYTFQDTESQILFGTVREVLGGAGNSESEMLKCASDILQIRHLLDRRPDQLSGGEAQRVVLLGALRTNPSVLIYDEAISALDPEARRDFGRFAELLASTGIATLLLGQRAQVLSPWCRRIIRLAQGRQAVLEVNEASPGSTPSFFWEKIRSTAPPAKSSVLALKRIQVRGVQRTRPRLAGIDFRLSPGERVALVGPNGAGKTTLLLTILGRIRPNNGTFEWNGRQFTLRQWRRRNGPAIALVSQSPHQRIVGSTIGEEFEIALGRVTSFSHTDFWPLLQNPFPYLRPEIDPFQLSYGQQRWLTTLLALLGNSSVILLDEPEQGLDTRTLRFLEMWLHNDAEKCGKSVVFSTHDLEFAASYADRCVLLNEGRILAEISLREASSLESWYFTQLSRVN